MVEITCIIGEKVGVNKEIIGGNEVVDTIFPMCSTPSIVTCSTPVKAFHPYNKMFHVFHQSSTCSTPDGVLLLFIQCANYIKGGAG